VAVLAAAMLLFHEPFGIVPMGGLALFFAAVACGNPIGGVLATGGALVLGKCFYGLYPLHGIVLARPLSKDFLRSPRCRFVAWRGSAAACHHRGVGNCGDLPRRRAPRHGRGHAPWGGGWWTGRRSRAVSAPELDVAP
jgi:hypothetical protein